MKTSSTEQTALQLKLSPFDQISPRLFVHKFFCFPFPDANRQSEAVEHLEKCLSATTVRWPFITGNVGPAKGYDREDFLEVHYTVPIDDERTRDILIVKNLSSTEFPWTYQQLSEAGVPLTAMNMKVLSTVPEWPKKGEVYPALAIQANFIPGGLLLCFAFHHAVADGTSFTTFIKDFAAGSKTCLRANSIIEVDMTAPNRLACPSNGEDEPFPLHSFPEFKLRKAPLRSSSPPTATTRIFTFSASIVRKLELAISKHLKEKVDPRASASTIGCLSGLVWVAVVRARQHRLRRSDIAKMGIAVNMRGVMYPPLPEDYFGNAIVHTHATAKVSELLDGSASANISEISSSIPVSAVALAAWSMRQAVRLDNKYIDERYKMFSSVSDPTEVSRAYARTMDTSNTGIDFSSWRDQGADVEFGIPGTATSTVEYWRKAWSPNEGAYNILPRRGGSKGPSDWEVSLGLSVEDMEKVCSADELGGWVSRIVE